MGFYAIYTAPAAAPAGAATAANQVVEIAAINSFAAKTASAFVSEPYDDIELTYVGSTTQIDTVTYKLSGVTVATLTLSYDGSSRLTGVVRS